MPRKPKAKVASKGLRAGPFDVAPGSQSAAQSTQAIDTMVGSFMGRSVYGADAYRSPLQPGEGRTVDLCHGCEVDCCSNHLIPLSVVDAYRIHVGLKLPFVDFAALVAYPADAPTWPVRLGRNGRALLALRRRRKSCIFLHRIVGHRLCAIHALRPMACRLFPFLPDAGAQRMAPVGMRAQRAPGDCPWRWPIDGLESQNLDALIAANEQARDVDQQVLRIWHRQLDMPHDRDHFYLFLQQEMARRAAGATGNGPWRTSLW